MKKIIIIGILTSLLSGCLVSMAKGGANFEESSSEKPAKTKTTLSDNSSTKPHVYAIRGLLGVFSTGMDKLVKQVKAQLHYPATALSHLETGKLVKHLVSQKQKGKKLGPIILVGHSFGADSVVTVADQLAKHNIPVEMIIPIDNTSSKSVPQNVSKLVHVHSGASAFSKLLFGWGKTLPADLSKTKVYEVNVAKSPQFKNINHFNIDEDSQVINYLVKVIKEGHA